MSDRRTKERERVWGRRPVILRFDAGHPRRNLEPESNTTLTDQAAASLLTALFQSVIQTDSMSNASPQSPSPQPRQPEWHLVEPGESLSKAVRKPIHLEQESAEAVELASESDATALATLDETPKPRQRPFWRLQSPHLSLNVFPPKRP